MFAILIGISLKSAAILAVAWLMTLLLRGRSAAARHLVWTAAAAAILALPLLSVGLPSWRVPVPQALAPANLGLVFRVVATAHEQAVPAGTAVRSAATAGSANAGTPALRIDWQSSLMALWALGTAILLLQMLVAFVRLSRLRARSSAWPDDALCFELAHSLEIRGTVDLLQGAPGSMPITAGVVRPAVFLPADATRWSESQLRVVLLHELAHVRRGDVAAHMIARAALSLNWWNPLAWMAWREFLTECERAADDLVLAAGARPSDYAGHLLEVARSMQSPAGSALAAVAMARPAQLEGRLLAILDSRVRRHAMARGALLAAMFAAILLVAPFAAVEAQDQSAQVVPPELDATISAANSQKNHEILEHAAAAYENLRKYDVAKTLLEDALVIRGQVSGDTSPAYATGLVRLGDLELKRHKVEEAKAFYTKAVSLGDRPEVAGALLYLGISSIAHDHDAARDYLQRTINVSPVSFDAASAYTWLAEMRRTEPEGANEAESLYQKALSVADPKTETAANTMHLYARFLDQQGRSGEAEVMEKQAADITRATATNYARQMGNPGVTFRSATVVGSKGYVQARSNEPSDATPTLPLPTPSAGAFRVGGGVSSPVLLRKVEPEYTEEARAAKYQGTVLVYIEVGPDGQAHNMKVIRGLGMGLDEKAIEALDRWKFKPGTKDGLPVTVQATIEVNFRLL